MLKYILTGFALVSALILCFIDPVSQDAGYHDFADQRTCLGIPNFWDVVSNALISAAGVWTALRFVRPADGTRFLRLTLISGMILTGIGSGYYHLDPDNATLVWDRIPMIMVFISFFSFLIWKMISPAWGRGSFYFLLPLGIFSVIYWYWTETQGHGDLRLYAFMQFFPMLSIPCFLGFGKPGKVILKYVLIILTGYIFAKITEQFDEEIYFFTGFWSGHTLKHFLSGISLFYMGSLLTRT